MKEQEILNRISIINVKNKLHLLETFSSGDIIYVRCPFCNSLKGSMKLNIVNNSYICKNCEEGGYAIGLYAKYNGITNKEAYKILINDEANLEDIFNIRTVINDKKSANELDYIYGTFLDMLDLSSYDTMKLLKLGFSIEQIEEIGFKTIPINEQDKINICKRLIDNGFELKGVPRIFSR